MLDAIAAAIALSRDAAQRARNLRESGLNRDWRGALAPVLAWIGDVEHCDV